jgi:peroxiredoxin Q/BCP
MSLADEKEFILNIGDKAPDISLNDQDGNLWRLDEYIGKKNIVIYFYPAAMTGGCTAQACSYRDSKSKLDGKDIIVVGVSSDAVSGLKIFQEAHQLNFDLLSDATGEIARKYGVPLEKGGTIQKKVGDKEVSLERSYSAYRWTFMIDKEGKISYKDTEVDAGEDSNNILKFFQKSE